MVICLCAVSCILSVLDHRSRWSLPSLAACAVWSARLSMEVLHEMDYTLTSFRMVLSTCMHVLAGLLAGVALFAQRTQPQLAAAPGGRPRRLRNHPNERSNRRCMGLAQRCNAFTCIKIVAALVLTATGLALELLRIYDNVLIAERVIAFSVTIAIATGCFYLWLTRHGGCPNTCIPFRA